MPESVLLLMCFYLYAHISYLFKNTTSRVTVLPAVLKQQPTLMPKTYTRLKSLENLVLERRERFLVCCI